MHFKYSQRETQSCLHNTRMLSVLLLPYKKGTYQKMSKSQTNICFYLIHSQINILCHHKISITWSFFFLISKVFKEVILSTKQDSSNAGCVYEPPIGHKFLKFHLLGIALFSTSPLFWEITITQTSNTCAENSSKTSLHSSSVKLAKLITVLTSVAPKQQQLDSSELLQPQINTVQYSSELMEFSVRRVTNCSELFRFL